MRWGTTFSKKYCQELKIDWQHAFREIIKIKGLDSIRLCAYWDLVEPVRSEFEFTDLDWQVELAAAAGLDITLAMGRKVPRWPEYHEPVWTDNPEKDVLNYITALVNHYSDEKAIRVWQLENEPFYDFGITDLEVTEDLVRKETELVRLHDSRDILITDSGENGDWKKASEYGDMVGVNVYKITYDHDLGMYNYNSFPPGFYTSKVNALEMPVIVVELQAEPWGPEHFASDLKGEEWKKSINPKQLQSNVDLVVEAGFKEVWFWGSEWWIYLTEQGDESMFEAAKAIISQRR
ncbi:MAG: hypothetical protein ACE5DX_03410 [Candidatus Dojkabacteria bacterium]